MSISQFRNCMVLTTGLHVFGEIAWFACCPSVAYLIQVLNLEQSMPAEEKEKLAQCLLMDSSAESYRHSTVPRLPTPENRYLFLDYRHNIMT